MTRGRVAWVASTAALGTLLLVVLLLAHARDAAREQFEEVANRMGFDPSGLGSSHEVRWLGLVESRDAGGAGGFYVFEDENGELEGVNLVYGLVQERHWFRSKMHGRVVLRRRKPADGSTPSGGSLEGVLDRVRERFLAAGVRDVEVRGGDR